MEVWTYRSADGGPGHHLIPLSRYLYASDIGRLVNNVNLIIKKYRSSGARADGEFFLRSLCS